MEFSDLTAPITPAEFLGRYRKGVCFFVRGKPAKFRDLVTLQEIEDRLNEGCNLSTPMQIIKDGQRHALVNWNHRWSPLALRKKQIKEFIETGHSFMMMNMSQINPRVARLLDAIEAAFSDDDLHADLHIYVSTTRAASAYNAHRDYPQHKIYLQVLGHTQWCLYEAIAKLPPEVVAIPEAEEDQKLHEVARFTLKPGDLFYMPPGVFHKIRNVGGPRVSFSIPCSPGGEGTERVDRTFIPFKAIFEAEAAAAAREPHDVSVDADAITVAHDRWAL